MINHEDKDNINKIKIFKKNVKKNILQMSLVAGANSSHFGGALSIVDIISTIFGYKIKQQVWAIDTPEMLHKTVNEHQISKTYAWRN